MSMARGVIFSQIKQAYYVEYDEEMVTKTKIVTLSCRVNPEQVISEIKKQLGNVYIRSVGKI